MNEFFDEFSAALAASAGRHGAHIETPHLNEELAGELLEVARVVAHTKERRFAPLACYLAGVAAARLQAASPKADLIAMINAVRLRYEPQEDSAKGAG